MAKLNKTLRIQSSPHLASGASVNAIMGNVILALMPVTLFAVYAFGLAALLTLSVAVIACVATEHLACRWSGQPSTVGDGSVVITGLLYGLTLPPGLALWMVALGGVVAVALGKLLFGGLGGNPFNPALVGRAFLQAAFPSAMTSWTPAFATDRFTTLPSSTLAFPFTSPQYDAFSGATPLAGFKFDGETAQSVDLFLGLTAGSLGETSSLLILAGGLYLIARGMMDWRIPAGIFLSVAVLSAIFHAMDATAYPAPLFMLFSGGLMLGAMFMATDMVASPITHLGCFVYGCLIGVLVVAIRLWSGLPEGVMYAILLANAVSPHIDYFVQPKGFGRE